MTKQSSTAPCDEPSLALNSFWLETKGFNDQSFEFFDQMRGVFPRLKKRSAKGRAARRDGDLLAWGKHFLPQHFRQPPSAMHREVAALLDSQVSRKHRRPEELSATQRHHPAEGVRGYSSAANITHASTKPRDAHDEHGFKLNVLAPRGSAKSTLVTLAFVLREALTGRQRFIWIVSDTKRQAMAHLENIHAELSENRRLAKNYRRARAFIRKGNRISLDGVVIEAYGAGQRVRGRRVRQYRPTMIVCDDLQNDGHIYSAKQRDQSRAWFHGMLMKAGTKRTHIINLGTALHREALSMELHESPGWTSRRFQAIQRWPTNMHLWSEWEEMYRKLNTSRGWISADAPEQRNHSGKGIRGSTSAANSKRFDNIGAAREFFNQHRDAMQLGAVLLWPEEEDLYTLMRMRAESGSTAFEREKQCVPLNPDQCEWPEEYFGDWLWFEQWPKDLRLKTMALDPSKGADAKRGDYSAFVMLGIDNDGTLYVEANLARRPTPQMVTDGVELARWFRPQMFGIETNQFQSLLGADFAADFNRIGLVGTMPCSIENQLAKPVRIRRLGPLLAHRKLRFKSNSPGTRMLVDQLREFPLAQYNDGPDALEMAVRLAESLAQPLPSDGLGKRLI